MPQDTEENTGAANAGAKRPVQRVVRLPVAGDKYIARPIPQGKVQHSFEMTVTCVRDDGYVEAVIDGSKCGPIGFLPGYWEDNMHKGIITKAT